jgi:hypothetical protein
VGGFASIPPDHAHFAWAGGQETMVQVHGVGPSDLRFVNPADDPRTKSRRPRGQVLHSDMCECKT